MRRILISLSLSLPIICLSQNKEIPPDISEMVCKASENKSQEALLLLSAQTGGAVILSIEKMKEVYINLMESERERLKPIIGTKAFDLVLNSSSVDFKYSLCEKLKRPSAANRTIASESYFLCRQTLSTGVEQRPPSCF